MWQIRRLRSRWRQGPFRKRHQQQSALYRQEPWAMKARFCNQPKAERKHAYGEEKLTLTPSTATLEQLYPVQYENLKFYPQETMDAWLHHPWRRRVI